MQTSKTHSGETDKLWQSTILLKLAKLYDLKSSFEIWAVLFSMIKHLPSKSKMLNAVAWDVIWFPITERK